MVYDDTQTATAPTMADAMRTGKPLLTVPAMNSVLKSADAYKGSTKSGTADTGLSDKTIGAFRASGQSNIGKFLSSQGGDKTTPLAPAAPAATPVAGGTINYAPPTAPTPTAAASPSANPFLTRLFSALGGLSSGVQAAVNPATVGQVKLDTGSIANRWKV